MSEVIEVDADETLPYSYDFKFINNHFRPGLNASALLDEVSEESTKPQNAEIEINKISNSADKFKEVDEMLYSISQEFDFSKSTITNSTTTDKLSNIDEMLKNISDKYGLTESNIPSTSNLVTKLKETPHIENSRISGETLMADLKSKYQTHNPVINNPSTSIVLSDSDNEDNRSSTNSDHMDEPVIKKTKQREKLSKDENVALKKTQQKEKRRVQELKKSEDARDKELKKAMAQALKSTKPEECLKYMNVHIDDHLCQKEYFEHIKESLKQNDITATQNSHIIPNSVTWTRRVPSHTVNTNGKVISTDAISDCDHILLLYDSFKITSLIASDDLISHMQTIKSLAGIKMLTLGVYGLNDYFKKLKIDKRQQFRSQVTEVPTKRQTKNKVISRECVEKQFCKLQITMSCSYRSLDSIEDVALLVFQMTKSIAQIPYKLEKQRQHEQVEYYASGDNKDCVAIDRNGNGLSRLWQQNLISFPLARLELAEAVLASYPTLQSLLKAYEECSNNVDREQLLENLLLRRSAGPLTSTRRIGPEFSRKVYKYYHSEQGNEYY